MTVRMKNTCKIEENFAQTLYSEKFSEIWPKLSDYLNFLISGLQPETRIIEECPNQYMNSLDSNISLEPSSLSPDERLNIILSKILIIFFLALIQSLLRV